MSRKYAMSPDRLERLRDRLWKLRIARRWYAARLDRMYLVDGDDLDEKEFLECSRRYRRAERLVTVFKTAVASASLPPVLPEVCTERAAA